MEAYYVIRYSESYTYYLNEENLFSYLPNAVKFKTIEDAVFKLQQLKEVNKLNLGYCEIVLIYK